MALGETKAQNIFPAAHDDLQGILGTALAGATQWTPLQYRTTTLVFNGVRVNDVFTMVFQMSHGKSLQTALDSIHLHWITETANTGTWTFSYAWGWYNENGTDVIPATLPNTGTGSITVGAGDQYKPKITGLISNLAAPTAETYSSCLYVTFTITGVTGTINATTDYCLIRYLDAHFIKNKLGSVNEYTD